MSDEPADTEHKAISDDALRELLDLFMASDPWPLEGDRDRSVLFGFICAETARRGYDDWIEAYHDFEPNAEVDKPTTAMDEFRKGGEEIKEIIHSMDGGDTDV